MTTTSESLRQAVDHHRKGQFDVAEQLYRQVLSSEPHHPEALHLLGLVAQQRGQYATAVDWIGRAIAVNGLDPAYHANLASCYFALGQTDHTIACLRAVLRLRPDHAKTHNDLGMLLANLGRFDEAAECFRQVLRIQPGNGAAHNNLGSILENQGRLEEAIRCYRSALAVQPNLAQAHNNLGNVLRTQGQTEEAIAAYREALRIQPDYAEAHYNLAIAQNDVQRPDEAVRSYREALRIRPDFMEAEFNLGRSLKTAGQLSEAVAAFERVVALRPGFAEAHYMLGTALKDQGHLEQAQAALAESVRLKPSLADAHRALGMLWESQGRFDEAIASLRAAVRENPTFVDAYTDLGNALHHARRLAEAQAAYEQAVRIDSACLESRANLGLVLQEQGHTTEAIESLRETLSLHPDFAPAHNGLGLALEREGNHTAALASFREAVRLQPDFFAARNNLGSVLNQLGQVDEAIACFEEAMRLEPRLSATHGALVGQRLAEQGRVDEALARFDSAVGLQPAWASLRKNRAMALLLSGNFVEGWSEFEWRWQSPDFPLRPWSQPLWDGSPLAERTIVLHTEQGLGDSLQFIRYASLVKHRGGTVVLNCPRRMIPILSSCAGIDRFSATEDPLEEFDVQAPLLSLPRIFHTDLASVPAEIPYLSAPSDLVERWRDALVDDGRQLRVGIGWQGSPTYGGDRARSIPLSAFAPLASVPAARFWSLQKGTGIEQLANPPFALEDLGSRLDLSDKAFMDTAAVIENLDLVITSDTALAHLAGALGARVWIALPFVPDFRWLLDRDDSPWYPTARLFRQSRMGDWAEVFERIAAELANLSAERTR